MTTTKTRTITVKTALNSDNISYRDFYSALQDNDIGYWDGINSTDIIHDYLNDMIRQGIRVSHIVEALEDNDSEYDDWCIWLGNSMNTPTPINSKQDLFNALGLDKDDLKSKINIELTQ